MPDSDETPEFAAFPQLRPQIISAALRARDETRKHEEDIHYIQRLPEAMYLEKTVIPLVTLGLLHLAEIRPNNPVEWLALFLLKNQPKRSYGLPEWEKGVDAEKQN